MTDINPHGASSQPWARCPLSRLAQVFGVFTDIDDTLTREGAIEASALLALERLNSAGVPVIAITGRPLGWSRPFAVAWPVAAIVAENGAVALRRAADGSLAETYVQDEPTRRDNARRLRDVAREIVQAVPGATLARDSAGRVTDIAVDHSEFAHLDEAAIARVVAIMQQAGMNATVSSIHINGWFGDHTKWTGACWMSNLLFGRDLSLETERWVYVGDSTNDQAMFARFSLSVGVANLMRFADALECWPAYLTRAERGDGFAEVARSLLEARQAAAAPNGPRVEPA